MKISNEGIALIKKFEGCKLTAYKPVAEEKYYTIGWGHYGPDVKKGQKITQAQADTMLINDLKQYEAYVNNTNYCPQVNYLTQSQFDALVSICYNAGCGNLKKLCQGNTVCGICQKISTFATHGANGKELAGLVKRRAAEASLFKSSKNLAPTPDNVSKLDVTKTIRKGSKGTHVKALQVALNKLLNLKLTVDGEAGDKTVEAIKKFQTKYKLTADGIAGTNTVNKINSLL